MDLVKFSGVVVGSRRSANSVRIVFRGTVEIYLTTPKLVDLNMIASISGIDGRK
jgi:hypothetical protein